MALGAFDGVHLGHQKVIGEAVRLARSVKGEATILTFHPHPAKILRPDAAPCLLTTEEQDYELFSALDVDICVVLDFNLELSQKPPIRFFEEIAAAAGTLNSVIVGPGWRFGRGREGNFAMLKAWADRQNVLAVEVPALLQEDQIVSSTVIRNALAAGDLDSAVRKLGRPYQITGRVVQGEGLGGKIGFPTANLDVENELLPANGVYAARALVEGVVFAAAVNIGTRPTITGSSSSEIRVEAHFLEFSDDLYGHHVRLDFLTRLRDERAFKNVEELRAQIEADVQATFYVAYTF